MSDTANRPATAQMLLDLAPRIRSLVTRVIRDQAEELELNMLEFDVLRAVEPANPLLKELASRFVISRSGATKLVDGLVRKGFVERREDTVDRRGKRLRLTARGRRALRRAHAHIGAELDGYVSALPVDEQARLGRSMAALLDEIERSRD